MILLEPLAKVVRREDWGRASEMASLKARTHLKVSVLERHDSSVKLQICFQRLKSPYPERTGL